MALVDPNIAMGFRPIQFEQRNPLQEYAQIQQLQTSQLQNQLARQQMEQEQGVIDYLNRADLSTPSGVSGLSKFGKTGLGYQKLLTEQQTNELKRQELKGKVRDQQMTALGTGLTSVLNDPSDSSLTAAFDRLDATGVDTTRFRQSLLSEPDLAKRKAVITQYVTSNPEGRQALTFVQPKPEKFDLNGKIVVIDTNPNSPTYKQQVQEFKKTATIADQLAREKFTWEKANPGFELKEAEDGTIVGINKLTGQAFPITMGGAAPMGGGVAPAAAPMGGNPKVPATGQTNAPQGGTTPTGVPLKGKGTALTESQGNATAFGMRMLESNKLLNNLEKSGTVSGGRIKSAVEGAINALVPFQGEKLATGVGNVMNVLPGVLGGPNEAQQQYQQAKTNFITAVLRKESGAAIGQNEFETEEKKYFPQAGDSKANIAQKQRARELAIEAMKIQAGPGAKSIGSNTGGWEVVR
jgi:hypothetical protein